MKHSDITITTQRKNANRHTERGMRELERSIQADGTIGAITVAANGEIFDGSARREVLETAGLDNAIIVRSDGSRPIVHIREDIPSADDPRAIRLGIAANKIAADNLSWDAAILADIQAQDASLLDGLFQDDELAVLLGEVSDQSMDALWAGMPDFEQTPCATKTISVHFASPEDFAAFAETIGQTLTEKTSYIWFPYREKDDLKDLRYEAGK